MNTIKSSLKVFVLFLSISILFASCKKNSSESGERTKTNINKDWQYLENDTENISDALNIENWQEINLPHSWYSLDATEVSL